MGQVCILPCSIFKTMLTYFVTVVSHAHKMFIKLTTGVNLTKFTSVVTDAEAQ